MSSRGIYKDVFDCKLALGGNSIASGFEAPQRIIGDMVQDKSKLISFFFSSSVHD